MTATGQHFEVFQGDSREINIPITDLQDVIVDLTPYDSIIWVAYHPTTKVEVIRKTLGSGITVPNPTDGIVKITLNPEDTANIIPNIYLHECEIKSGATIVSTVSSGNIKIIYSAIK